MPDSLPLEGLRVLELGHIVAGPSAGLLLADLGADVVKVERPGEGDQARGMPAGNAANFHFLNRNKRSIAIDLKGSSEGRELFLRLVKGSDIVIDNFAHGAVEGLGLGYDVLVRTNPGIIYLALKGFLPGPGDVSRARESRRRERVISPAGSRPFGARAVERGAIPTTEVRRGVIRALKEVEDSRVR
jgi:crotonobetainyl-CoA:carnitine CoA-transferase CaiB-like acyl-CoA transferase